jgi:hypothetical protein
MGAIESKTDRFWLKNYPAGVPADVDISQYKSLLQLLDEAFKKYSAKPAYSCMGATMTYRELDANSAAIGAWLQSKGLTKGKRVAIMMPNVLQYPAVLAGVLRAGCTVVNVNPLYTPRELEHQLKDSGADAIFILENFATTLQQVLDKVPTKLMVVCTMGDLLGFAKGLLVNFVVRNVKKMVPEFSLPNTHKFLDVLSEGLKMNLKPVEMAQKRRRLPAVHRRHHGCQQGCHAAAQEHHRQHAAVRGLVPAGDEEAQAGRAGALHRAAAAVSHLRAHGVRDAVDAPGRPLRAHSQPARHPGLRQGAGQVQVQRVPGGQHAVQRAAEQR